MLRGPIIQGTPSVLAGPILLVLAVMTCLAERGSNWRAYRLADGLPESACVSVTASPQGRILVRHLHQDLVSVLDGYGISVLPASESGKGRVYESPGGQLWIASPQGLEEFRNGSWILHNVPEIELELRSGLSRLINPVPLYPARQGQVLYLLPGGLYQYTTTEGTREGKSLLIYSSEKVGVGRFTAMNPSRDGGLWLTAAHGLVKVPGPVRNLQPDGEWLSYKAESVIEWLQDPYESDAGSVIALAGTTTNSFPRCVVEFDGHSWSRGRDTSEKLRCAWRGPDGQGWAMTISGLFRWANGSALTATEDINSRQYFDLAMESSGSFWLATSDGLFRFAPLVWRTPPELAGVNGLVHCMAEDESGRLWFVAGNVLHGFDGQATSRTPLPDSYGIAPHAMWALRDGSVLLGFKDPDRGGDLALRFNPKVGQFRSVVTPVAERLNLLGPATNLSVYVQRLGPDQDLGTLEAYDGVRFQPVRVTLPADIGKDLTACFVTRRGEIWLSGAAGTAVYQEQKWRVFPSSDKDSPDSAVAFTELGDGKVFCGTRDQLWEFDGRHWTALRRGLDRINSLVCTREGSLWVASNSGLHRFREGSWMENTTEDGLTADSVGQVLEDRRGRLWAATTRGISRQYPDADPDPPRSTVASYPVSADKVQHGAPVTVLFTGTDKWKQTARDRLLFSYRLDDSDWSSFLPLPSVQLPDLAAGKHFVQVRAMDRNGNIEAKPAQLELLVVLPWYQETRLVLIGFAGLAVALFFAAVAFNRHRQLLRSYAEVELKVAERSRQLELANVELMQSQKMNALGTLAAGIAHDFNNILSIIKGSAQIIEDNLDRPEKVRTRVDRINTVVEQGAGIVKAMLGFCRDSEQPAPADIREVVKDTIRLLGDRFLREMRVRYEPEGDLPPVMMSRAFTQQILLNLILNAAESMSQRNDVVLSTRLLESVPAGLALTPEPAVQYVAVAVRDHGCGIPAENLMRIFEPFFTTKAFSSRRGTGLGLSMAYELARKMGSGLGVTSEVGKGSVFTLYLPVRPVAPSQSGTKL